MRKMRDSFMQVSDLTQKHARINDDAIGNQRSLPYGCFSRYRATSKQMPRANTVLSIHLAISATSKGRESGLKPECLL